MAVEGAGARQGSVLIVSSSVLASPSAMPHFWIFMYRLSPFTYLVSSVMSVGVGQTTVHCASNEVLRITAPPGQSCSSYLGPYMHYAGGQLLNSASPSQCEYCPMSTTDQFLAAVNISYGDRWRNIGILFVYIVFNFLGALFLYWLIRVPKKSKRAAKHA